MIRYALLFLVACGPGHKPDASTPSLQPPADASAPPAVMTKEDCEAQGHRFNPSIGGGDQPHCADGETELGPARFGIEGGWCCKKP